MHLEGIGCEESGSTNWAWNEDCMPESKCQRHNCLVYSVRIVDSKEKDEAVKTLWMKVEHRIRKGLLKLLLQTSLTLVGSGYCKHFHSRTHIRKFVRLSEGSCLSVCDIEWVSEITLSVNIWNRKNYWRLCIEPRCRQVYHIRPSKQTPMGKHYTITWCMKPVHAHLEVNLD